MEVDLPQLVAEMVLEAEELVAITMRLVFLYRNRALKRIKLSYR